MKTRIARFAVLPTVLLGGVALFVAPSQTPAQQKRDGKEFDALAAAIVLEKTLVDVIARAEKSVVSIARIKDAPRSAGARQPNFFGRRQETDDPTSPDFIPSEFGSGIIIPPLEKSGRPVILTNYHVVKGGPVARKKDDKPDSRLFVRLHDRRGFYASIIAADPRSDLAVLAIDFDKLGLKPAELTPMKLGSRDAFRKGQLVVSLGNPYAQARDGSASASWGMISNILRRPKPPKPTSPLDVRRNDTIHHYGTLLQVDTRLSIGTSGGALLNLKGELIGITTSLAALAGYESSAGYAVPMDAATRRIVTTLAKGLEVEYGYLGISPDDYVPDRFRGPNRNAASVTSVHPRSPAERAGLRPADVILAINGQSIYNQYDLMRVVGLQAPETRVPVRVWRGAAGRELELTVSLGKWPAINDEDIIATARRRPPWRGVTIDYPTARRRFMQLPFRYYRAVVVLDVANAALKKSGDLQPGDFVTAINGSPVETPSEFQAAVRNLKGPVKLRLHSGSTVTVPE